MQTRMIDRVLNIVCLYPENQEVKLQDFPAYVILDKDPNGKPHKEKWNYRSAVRCLYYILDMIRPDITMAVQQCSRFCN